MCGTYASISRRKDLPLSATLQGYLASRGPDHLGNVQRTINPGGEAELYLTCVATVLSLRGQGVTRQPLEGHSTGSILCWNGEAWSIGGRPIPGNDGAAVLAALDSAANPAAALDGLRAIEGPFAFVYYDPRDGGRVYFGRDRLGRRSLLVHDGEGDFVLSSVADPGRGGWAEVEADGVYVLDVAGLGDARPGDITMRVAQRHDWLPGTQEEEYMSNIGLFNTALPPEDCPPLSLVSRSVISLQDHLVRSLSLRVLDVPRPPLEEPVQQEAGVDTRIAILFSGGLDCTVLAKMASELLPPDQGIDLINVAFENPRIAARLQPTDDPMAIYEACPDRITGRKSFSELCAVCPRRPWQFIAVNVPYSETQSHRSEVVALMHPHNTEMDLSIACALYFAARGRGLAQTAPETTTPHATPRHYTTPARVLLSGLGADELFGGYVRHATAFSRRGHGALIEELRVDVGRLGKRNLGRDDRVMSHWGREVRFPFLDEGLVRWAVESPVWEKCGFGAPAVDGGGGGADHGGIEPDKRVLRLLAEKLGLHSVAREKKRAIQFGSRTAKMESGKVKGTTLIA